MEDESTCYCSLVQQGQGRVAVQGSERPCREVQGSAGQIGRVGWGGITGQDRVRQGGRVAG